MAKPTLTVVGGKTPEPDAAAEAEAAEMIAKATLSMTAAVKAGGLYWLIAVTEEDDLTISYFGGELESAALAEVIAGDMKRAALGLE